MAPLHISPLTHYCTPRLHSLPPRHSPKLALSFAGITSGRGGQRATLPATSSKKSGAGVSFTLPTSLRCRTTPLHALPYSQHYACFILASLALLTSVGPSKKAAKTGSSGETATAGVSMSPTPCPSPLHRSPPRTPILTALRLHLSSLA